MWASHPDILAMAKIGLNSQEKHIIRRFSGRGNRRKISCIPEATTYMVLSI